MLREYDVSLFGSTPLF